MIRPRTGEHIQVSLDGLIKTELIRAFPRLPPQTGPQALVRRQTHDATCERSDIPRLDEESLATLLNDLRNAANRRGQDGQSRCHGLEHRHGKSLLVGGQCEHIARAEEPEVIPPISEGPNVGADTKLAE